MRDRANDRLDADTETRSTGEVLPEPGELPVGLINLTTATNVYRRPVGTLRQAARNGQLRRMRRQQGAAPGGYVVVNPTELETWLASRKNAVGRPLSAPAVPAKTPWHQSLLLMSGSITRSGCLQPRQPTRLQPKRDRFIGVFSGLTFGSICPYLHTWLRTYLTGIVCYHKVQTDGSV